jgi:TRAP-type C4-dicarboxylate transport system permease small subunit
VETGRETLSTSTRYGKWAGMYGGVIATFVHQQVNSTWIYARCPERTLRVIMIFATACALFSIITGVWSWGVRQSLRADAGAHATTKTDRFIATLSAAIAVIGVVFIAFASAAAWFLQCQR